jgi:HlyD family secretion protein
MNHNGEPEKLAPGADSNLALRDRVRSLRLQDRNNPSSPRSRFLPWVLCVILLGTTAAFGYRAYRVTPTVAPSEEVAVEPSAGSQARVASSGNIVLQAKGYIVPAHQVQVSPKVGGMIVRLNPRFKEGAYFEKGEELAWLEDDDYRADRDHALAVLEGARQRYIELDAGNRPEEIEQARADLKETERNLEQLQLDRNRARRLAVQSAVASSEYEEARSQYDAMVNRVQRLRLGLKLMEMGPRKEQENAALAEADQARADLFKAQWRLNNCVVRAPISGTVLTKKAEQGNIVNPAAFNISASLCDMADLGNLEVDLAIQERDIANVVGGQSCQVMPEAYQNHEPFRKKYPNGYAGVVDRLMPIADRAKGAIPVRVRILEIPREEQGVYLRPEMGVLVSFKRVETE